MKTKYAFIVPSLTFGGMERVMVEIVNHFSKDTDLETHLILLSKNKIDYSVNSNVLIHEPASKTSFLNLFFYVRNVLKEIKPYSLLSFGSMFNSFVIIASLNLGIKIYVSDRSNPRRNTYLTLKNSIVERHDGILHFVLKRIFYKKTTGIISQTKLSKEIEESTLKHENVVHIPNPIKKISLDNSVKRDNIILNVGRFISTKRQKFLIDVFDKINPNDWKLLFLGDGPEFEETKKYAGTLKVADKITFLGNQKNVDYYYNRAKIFAFTSISEGFPNALGEALFANLACISTDCEAGPSDMIIDGYNGYLVKQNDSFSYEEKLKKLVNDKDLRLKFIKNTEKVIENFDRNSILAKIKNTITK